MLRPPINNEDQKFGNINATVVLVEYGDYQCTHCGHAHFLLKQLKNEFSKNILFIFRNFPLAEIHPLAKPAAWAAEASGRQGKFWEMHDLIFKNQNQLDTESSLYFAEKLSLNEKKFKDDLKTESILSKVISDFESGVRSGVNGTPTFFLNGNRLNSYNGSYESLKDPIISLIIN